jgi:hypothetical protein
LLLGVVPAGCRRTPEEPPPSVPPVAAGEDVGDKVHTFCAACHTFPPPDTFPRRAWREEVERGYGFFEQSGRPLRPPLLEATIKYFQERAPDELPLPQLPRASTPLPVRLERKDYAAPAGALPASVSHVSLALLAGSDGPEVLACDMKHGIVMALRPGSDHWRILYQHGPDKGFHPARAEVVDLDGDDVPDILVANLGSYPPTDALCGSVVWLRGGRDGRFTAHTLLEGVGRVADVQAADFRGRGRKDLVVAVFGWQDSGDIRYLENRTTDWSRPRFVSSQVLDPRHGAIHVPVYDLNGDGRPDFVALLSQEYETVIAFLNDGKGGFLKEVLYTAPHPGYGSSGIQLVDFNRDGRIDVLYTNGDVLDRPYLLKPYHSVQWLENRTTDWSRPHFVHHPIGPMYGVHRAVAADLDGDGKMEVVAVSFLPAIGFPRRKELDLDAVVVFEQTGPGQFARHVLQSASCDHVCCAAGDFSGTGRPDLVIGSYANPRSTSAVTLWKNLGGRGR